MQAHLILFFYIFTAIAGFLALGLAVFGTLKSKIRSYWYLVLFFGFFTLMVILIFVRNYLHTNLHSLSTNLAMNFQAVSTILSLCFMTMAICYYQSLFLQKGLKWHRMILIFYVTAALLLFYMPGGLTLEESEGILLLGVTSQVALLMHHGLFLYLLILGVKKPHLDRPFRERLLVWSLNGFAVIGFIEGLINGFEWLPVHKVDLFGQANEFLFSSIPYLFFGFILIYYFGSYLLSSQKVSEYGWLDDFGLSPREKDVVPLLNRGLNNREIAEMLCISLSTVKTHIHNIYGKTGVNSRYQLFHLKKK